MTQHDPPPDLHAIAASAAQRALGDSLVENAALLVFQELVRRDLAEHEDGVTYRTMAVEAWKAGRAFARARPRGER